MVFIIQIATSFIVYNFYKNKGDEFILLNSLKHNGKNITVQVQYK